MIKTALKITVALFLAMNLHLHEGMAIPCICPAAEPRYAAPIHYFNDLLPAGALARFSGHEGTVFRVAFSPGGTTLATGTAEGRVMLCDTVSGKCLELFHHIGHVSALAISPDGKTLATGHYNEGLGVHLWDLTQGRELYVLKLQYVTTLAFSPDSKTLISGGVDRTIRFWEVAMGRETRRIKTDHIGSLAVAPDGKTLASGSYEGLIQFWDVASGRELGCWQPHEWFEKTSSTGLVFSPCGKMLASLGLDCNIFLRDVATGKERLRLRAHDIKNRYERRLDTQELKWGVNWVAFSPNGKLLASAGSDDKILLWDVATGAEVGRFEGHQGSVYCVAFSPDGKVLASASGDDTVLLWDVTLRLKDGRLPAANLEAKHVASSWNDLTAPELLRASQAFWTLVAAPEQTPPFFRKHLLPALPIDAPRIARLIGELDSASFQAREAATRELLKLAELARPALREALGKRPPLEAQRRIQQILDQWEEPAVPTEQLRLLRAVQVLEHIDTNEARQVLETVAKGAPEARLTREAKESLRRLAQRPNAKP